MSDDPSTTADPAIPTLSCSTTRIGLADIGSEGVRSRSEMSNNLYSTYTYNVSPSQRQATTLSNVPPLSKISPPNNKLKTEARMKNSTSGRVRGLSRSSSVPSMARIGEIDKIGHDQSTISPLTNETFALGSAPTRHSTSSVKHLTCFWWKEKGSCRFNEQDCLYAHRDTGHYTDPPRQLIPGEPALAGRKLDRAVRNLAIAAHRSSTSLNNMTTPRHVSRPSTPVPATDPLHDTKTLNALSFNPILPSPAQSQFGTTTDLVHLNNDNQFLRKLVEASSKEKATMISTIDALHAEVKGMKGELDGLRKAQEQLLAEREGLHNRIQQLEDEKAQNCGQMRSVSNPFGAIGRGRVNTEARYLGGLLTDE